MCVYIFVQHLKTVKILWILLMFCNVVLSKKGYDEEENDSAKSKKAMMQGRTMSREMEVGQGKFGWEGNCIECSLMDVDFYNLTVEEVPEGCMDERVQYKQTSNNSEYCSWRLIHTDGKYGKVGLIGVKADELNHMDPKPESCVKHKFHYTCACLGEYCNKGLPPCKWITKVDPGNKYPVGCLQTEKVKSVWVGNCVECSLMDVDFYNLTVDELKGGCLDKRVQHFEKTNDSPYCTWRIIHTEGKAGAPGLLSLLGDHLNHMDPKPGECVKHSFHYTCACVGEYCNEHLPPCDWITKVDPKNKKPLGCSSDGKAVLLVMGQINSRGGACVKCDLGQDQDKLKKMGKGSNRGCKEPEIQDTKSISNAEYCMWNIVQKTETWVNSHKVFKGSLIATGTALLPKENPKPDTCLLNEGKHFCSCKGHFCNLALPLCTWMRKANPEEKRPLGCFEDNPKRSGSTKCVKCFFHYNVYTRYKNMERACEDPRVQDYMTLEDANYCMTVIDYERKKGMSLVKDHDLDNFKLEPGTCKLAHQKYWCACKGDWCNREPPPCSWMRKANPQDKDPKGCIEDGFDAKGSCVYCVAYHSKHQFGITTADLKFGCQDPRINVRNYRRNAPYCMWMIRRTNDVVKGYEWRKEGWVTWKGDTLLKKDPEPGTCIMESHSYICACKGNLCNKALPPCSWIRKVNPKDENPKACAEDDESKALMPGTADQKVKAKAVAKGEGRFNWEGNCVECSLMDVDFYNLTVEELPDGCMDPRVQYYEKTNNSEYCTWRLIHTEGKHGKAGLISVKADQLNHMDPPPESCVKHKFHYTCACIGEYCNKGLPPCTWIRKCDPENTNPIGCRNPNSNTYEWIGNCVECSLMDVDHYNLKVEQLKDGCMDPRVQYFQKKGTSPYCTWRVIHTLGKSGTKPGILALKADRLNHMDPSPGTCVKHENHYTCACTGEYCNRNLPPCAWIRKIDPGLSPTFKGCTEHYTGCVSCDLLQSEKRYKIPMDKTKDGCMDTRIQDTNSIQIAEYCMWTITSTEIKNYKWPEGHAIRAGTLLLPQASPRPGTCRVSDGNFYCSCYGHLCNMVTPRCSMLRKAMSSKTWPKGCFEDERRGKGQDRCAKCFYHPHAWSSKKDIKNGCEDPRIQDMGAITYAEYCIWVIDYLHFKGLIIMKDRNLDPDLKLEPGKCKLIDGRYFCACKGNMCNKLEPKCSWLRKANDKDKNPKGCIEDESKAEVKEEDVPKGMIGRTKVTTVSAGQGSFDWEGNCVECSIMDVDHYNLAAEDLVDGCMDPRVQHYEKTNNSEYCTWRLIHTEGKFGKPGLINVKADKLNHMDPKPESCVKHAFHYTCACIGEYCNKNPPPCSWIRKCDPQNKDPIGCLGASVKAKTEGKWMGNCVECSLMDVDDYNLTPEELDGGCQDPRVQHYEKTNTSEYCAWRLVHTLGKTGTPPGHVTVKADKLNHMDPPPGTCVKHKQHYTCACEGEYCNKDLPPCSWIRAIDPENTEPLGCTEDDPSARKPKAKRCKEGNPGIDCAYCSLDDLRRNDSKTPDNACNDLMNMDFETQHGTKYEFTHCGWTIQGKEIEGYRRGAIFAKRGAFAMELEADCPGTCTFNDENMQRYYCHCGQDRCNTKLPPCSWLRAANPEDTDPLGCVEDGIKAPEGASATSSVMSNYGTRATTTTKKPSFEGTHGGNSVQSSSSSKTTTTSSGGSQGGNMHGGNSAKPATTKKPSFEGTHGGNSVQSSSSSKTTTTSSGGSQGGNMHGGNSAKSSSSSKTTTTTTSSGGSQGGNMHGGNSAQASTSVQSTYTEYMKLNCPKDVDSFEGIDCAYCSLEDLRRTDKNARGTSCNYGKNMDFTTQHGTKYKFTHCGWTIQGTDMKGYKRGDMYAKRGAYAKELQEDKPGSCTFNDENLGRYYCSCCGDNCNANAPPCSWLRAANPNDTSPMPFGTCKEDKNTTTTTTSSGGSQGGNMHGGNSAKTTSTSSGGSQGGNMHGGNSAQASSSVQSTYIEYMKLNCPKDIESFKGIDCAYCSLEDLRRNDSKAGGDSCNYVKHMDFTTQHGTKYKFTHCGWTIQGTDIKGYKRGDMYAKRGAYAQELQEDKPGSCTFNDENLGRYYCSCCGNTCNTNLPPCSWLRAANAKDKDPLGCQEDGIKAPEGASATSSVMSNYGTRATTTTKKPSFEGTHGGNSVQSSSSSKSTTTSSGGSQGGNMHGGNSAQASTSVQSTYIEYMKLNCPKEGDGFEGIDCAYCSLEDLRRTDKNARGTSCNYGKNMDFTTQHGTKYKFTHCGWTIQGTDIKDYKRGDMYAKRGAYAQELQEDKPGSCTFNDENLGRYYCSCCGDNCNTNPPPCSWLRAANPNDTSPMPFGSCKADKPTTTSTTTTHTTTTTAVVVKGPRKGYPCVACKFDLSQPAPYPDVNNGCEDTRLHNYNEPELQDSEYCLWKIGSDNDPGKGILPALVMMLDGDRLRGYKPGTCRLWQGSYVCACRGYLCNRERPPCSWLRAAFRNNQNPPGCFEDQYKFKTNPTVVQTKQKIQTEYEGSDKRLIVGNERVTTVGVKRGEGRFDWEGNCVECSLMDVDFYNLTTEDVPDGCQDPRIQYFETANNSEYCTWRIIHKEGKHGKAGIVSVKADQLNHMDPPPETCVKHRFHYTCACIGEYCNKDLPPCSWIKRADPENKNPVGCLGAQAKVASDWMGNCIECSVMDVDFYGLSAEDLKGGCMDPRVQHYEKTNDSPYCTWRIVHTKGKAGNPGLVVVKADRLNHMDPKPSSCVKHRNHYTCACTGEYCNKLLPPCAWITAIDPDNKYFPGCLENGPKEIAEAPAKLAEFDDEYLILQIKYLIIRIRTVLLTQKNSRRCVKTDSAKIAEIIKNLST